MNRLNIMFGLVFAFMFLISGVYADIIPDKNYVDVTYYIGGSQPQDVVITLSNDKNETVEFSVTKSGTASDFFTFEPTDFVIQNLSSDTLTIMFNIPNTTQPGLYKATINYEYGEIPVFITVQQQTTSECRLIPTITSYIQRIEQDASPYTEKFNIKVSSGCVGGVDITDVFLLDTTQTSEGQKPIRLSGSQSLGFKMPGETATFTVEIDVSGLPTGTYSPYAKIIADYNGNTISTTIDFEITVVGSASPITGEIKPPTYEIPSQVKAGEEFEIKAIDVDPNIDVYLFPEEFLTGVSVEETADRWIWKGYINETGDYTIRITSFYKGGMIGGVYKKDIKVVGVSYSGSSGYLKFDFFPKVEELGDGDTVNILCRDNKTNDIVNCEIYLNGALIQNHSIVVNAGNEYCLSATSPGYSTLDYCFNITPKELKIIVTPEEPVVGDIITIETRDPTTNNPVQSTIIFDGKVFEGSVLVQTEGNHTIEANAQGYTPTKKVIVVKKGIYIMSAPKEIQLNVNQTIVLSGNATWKVAFEDTETHATTIIAEGNNDRVTFLPQNAGIYRIYVNEEQIRVYKIEGLKIPQEWLMVIAGVVFAIVIIFIVKRMSSGRVRRSGYGIPSKPDIVVG